MQDLMWVRKQGQIASREKKRVRRNLHIPLQQKLDSLAELYEIFEPKLKATEAIFAAKRTSEKIALQKRMIAINHPQD